jgi:hypothetical protein
MAKRRLGWYRAEQLTLKITLLGSEPKIWRRVRVHSGLTLHDLHYVVQCLFDWEDSHLYQFHVTAGGKLTRAAMRDAVRYHVMPPDEVFADMMHGDLRADEALVGRIFTDQRRQIVYEYDLGDSWEHLVKLEKRTPGGDQDEVPVCLAGENAAPREDMGGIYGYHEWLAALLNPRHEMHQEAAGWLGADFDPARFDLESANKRLAAAFRPPPKKKKRRPRGGRE